MPLVIGVDSSTQSVKVEARDLATGTVVATGTAKHPPTTPPVSEQDPRTWWSALVEAATAQLGEHRTTSSRSRWPVSSTVACSSTPAVNRCGPPSCGTTRRRRRTRNVSSSGSVPTLGGGDGQRAGRRVHDHQARLGRRARTGAARPRDGVMLPHDYLTWRLSGAHVTDRGDASGTGWYDATSETTCARRPVPRRHRRHLGSPPCPPSSAHRVGRHHHGRSGSRPRGPALDRGHRAGHR